MGRDLAAVAGAPSHSFASKFVSELRMGMRHHMLLFVGGAVVFAAGYALAVASGYMLAPSPLDFAASYVGVAALIVGLTLVLLKMLRMALVERPQSPVAELARWVRHDVLSPARLANGICGMTFVFLLLGGFTMAKNTISRFGGFRWDASFAELDRMLHFGVYPHELLQPVLGHPWITFLLDRNYVLWFSVLFASCFIASFQVERSFARHRFLLALLLVWGIGGVVLATLFASAGPVYFARVTGATDPYAAHFAYLHQVASDLGLKALGIQEKLWATYTAEPSLSLISAMPSMHSAITVLVFLACWQQGGWLRIVGGAFTAMILLGSVHLGWHYAIDAYAGILIAAAAWMSAGRATAWYLRRDARPA
jgi:hypothetical protein